MYKCGCGKEYEKLTSLRSHARFCKFHIPRTKPSVYKLDNGKYKCECGKEFLNPNGLNGHFTKCLIHRKGKAFTQIDTFGESRGWSKGLSATTDERVKNISIGVRLSVELGKKSNGHAHTEETKRKIRKSFLSRMHKNGRFGPTNFNLRACEFIDNLNKEFNWNLIHAKNGGEFYVNGYYLDGYDKQLNIAFEYDEQRHYTDWENNKLKNKDILRQFEIMNALKCKFYRYNEKLNLMYEIKLF